MLLTEIENFIGKATRELVTGSSWWGIWRAIDSLVQMEVFDRNSCLVICES